MALAEELGTGQQSLQTTKVVHHLVPGTTHNGRKNCSWSIISSEAGFAEPWPIVTNKGSAVLLLTHLLLQCLLAFQTENSPRKTAGENYIKTKTPTQVAEPAWLYESNENCKEGYGNHGDWGAMGGNRLPSESRGGFNHVCQRAVCTRDYPGNSRGDFQPCGMGRESREQQMFI